MNEHVEQLVPVKSNAGLNLLKILLWVITVLFALLGLVGIFGFLPIILAIATGAGAYYAGLRVDTEYEYTLTDKEIDIDVIYSKQKRKHITTINLTKLEIMAKADSHRLDGINGRQLKTEDYSSKDEANKGKVFVLVYDGTRKLYIEPDERLFKAIHNCAPHKVFND